MKRGEDAVPEPRGDDRAQLSTGHVTQEGSVWAEGDFSELESQGSGAEGAHIRRQCLVGGQFVVIHAECDGGHRGP